MKLMGASMNSGFFSKVTQQGWIGCRCAGVALALLLGLAQTVKAAPVISFAVIPSAASAGVGETIGWGYEITNNSTEYYVSTALNADTFQWALPLALFDFPVLAPGATISQAFVADLAGLFQMTWEAAAPDGFVNTGVFVLSGDFYNGDPLSGGSFLAAAPDAVANYTALMQSATAVPEPSTLLLVLAAFGLMQKFMVRTPRT